MLPLESKVMLGALVEPGLLKIAGLAELAEGRYPLHRMALDIRELPEAASSPDLMLLPWAAIIAPTGHVFDGDGDERSLVLLGDQGIAKVGDVIEIDRLRGKAAVRYRRGDNGNVLFATERCNSFCLMCSQPPRQVQDDWRVQHLLELIDLIDVTEPSLAISGGEPTLLSNGLARVVEKCADVLPSTQLHILSNGRLLNDTALASQFRDIHPNLSWGVPLYGDHYALHDYVVQSEGAFAQTIRGLYALNAAGQRIEIRVVLVKPSLERLQQITRFILRNLSFVEHVALMGTEPIGFAKAHHEQLWADPANHHAELCGSVEALSQAGVPVSLYNMPLCMLPHQLWPFARQSISNWKNDYLDVCATCTVKNRCGGFFSWVTPQWTSSAVKPILETDTCQMH